MEGIKHSTELAEKALLQFDKVKKEFIENINEKIKLSNGTDKAKLELLKSSIINILEKAKNGDANCMEDLQKLEQRLNK